MGIGVSLNSMQPGIIDQCAGNRHPAVPALFEVGEKRGSARSVTVLQRGGCASEQ